MLAYDYPLLGMFWTLLWFFLWVAWIIILFRVFIDIFRSHDLGGWGKGLWAIFVLIVPFLGVFIYLIARGHGMQERDIKEAQAKEQAFRSYVQERPPRRAVAAPPTSSPSWLTCATAA